MNRNVRGYSYIDFYTKPINMDEALSIIKYNRKLGYRLIGIDYNIYYNLSKKEKIKENTIPVLYLEAEDEHEAKRNLKNIPEKNITIIGKALGAGALRFFSRNIKISVVELAPRLTPLLDKNQANLMRLGNTLLGLNLSIIKRRPSMIPWMESIIARAWKYGIKTIAYSGARNWSQLWHPRTIMGLFLSLGYPKEHAISLLTLGEELVKKEEKGESK